MKHAALVVGLALGVSACKDEAPAPAQGADPEAADATPEVPDQTPDQSPDQDPAPDSGASEGQPPADGRGTDSASRGKSGLLALTRDVIDQARAEATGPIRLVPDSAGFAMQVRLPALLAHTEARAGWDKLEDSDPDVKNAMDVVRLCLGRLEAIEEVVVGFDLDDHLVLVGRGKGLGTDTTWQCFAKEATARGESLDLDITGTPRGEGPQLRESDKSPTEADVGYFPNDDTFVMVSHEWDAQVRALIEGEGTPAIEGRLAAPLTRAQPEHTFWMVGRWDPAVSSALPDPIRGLEDLALSVDIEDEALVVDVSVDAGEPVDATRTREALQKQFDEFKSMLGVLGLPPSVGPKIVFEGEGDLVSLAFTLTRSELEGLRSGIERTL